jgi:hypothetical protein
VPVGSNDNDEADALLAEFARSEPGEAPLSIESLIHQVAWEASVDKTDAAAAVEAFRADRPNWIEQHWHLGSEAIASEIIAHARQSGRLP